MNNYYYTAPASTIDFSRSAAKGIVRGNRWWLRIFALLGATAMFNSQSHAQDDDISDLSIEPHNTGWAFYLDNDVLTTGDRDQDYTGGFAFTLSGVRALEYPISIDGWLAGLDRFSRFRNVYRDRDHFQRHSFEYGVTLFTPSDISVTAPIPDDHPYASLFFISNTEQTVVPGDDVSYSSTLLVGFLGLDMAEGLQRSMHDLLGVEEPLGWDNQISSGGEPTFKYTVSRQKTRAQNYRPSGIGREFKTMVEGNIGFSTDVNAGFTWRWGRISTPWWSFNPHQAEYVNLGSPVVGRTNQDSPKEFYFWFGASVKYRFYNAILQGQVRDSAVTFGRSGLEHVIGEAWMGVTKEFGRGWRGSLVIRGRTEEIKGPSAREPVWGSIILSKAY